MTKAHQQHVAARKKARHYAVQAVYQWQMAGAEPAQIEAEFRTDNDMAKVDVDYFHDLLHGVVKASEGLEAQLRDALDRDIGDLDRVELATLKVGCFELLERVDVPYRVVINEYVNLAKKFGATDSHKYINGVLDTLANSLRQAERQADQ